MELVPDEDRDALLVAEAERCPPLRRSSGVGGWKRSRSTPFGMTTMAGAHAAVRRAELGDIRLRQCHDRPVGAAPVPDQVAQWMKTWNGLRIISHAGFPRARIDARMTPWST